MIVKPGDLLTWRSSVNPLSSVWTHDRPDKVGWAPKLKGFRFRPDVYEKNQAIWIKADICLVLEVTDAGHVRVFVDGTEVWLEEWKLTSLRDK